MASGARPLRIWAVSDGRAGIEAQALGLAEAIARLKPAHISVKRIGWKAGLGRLPWQVIPLGARTGDPIQAPYPDIWIAAGRATLPLSTRMLKLSEGKTFVVQAQDPRAPLGRFDLVIPPEHDGLAGANVFPILGAPNRITPEKLALDLARFDDAIAPLPHPRVAVIVGGRSKAHDLPLDRARALAADIGRAIQAAGGSLLLSFTRRTPAAARQAITVALAHLPGIIWDGSGDNPYFAFLAAADAILVTEDSTNLATDAAATGKPLFVLAMAGRSAKLARFHAALRARDVAKPFVGELTAPPYPPLLETDRAAREVLRRYDGSV
ncbi:MAG: mitochondrial fission ELM1 family protein [Alphaproteobacteria bacterium]|nr:mitochondrial fission ELM1 family protein [Alphaproteobacteria bacterium]MBU1513465.1 mitochondrial fission ELM1 family protein [Alphaproteobacteria bacterium]MBU2096457.1 mitochondrial fission ELM1 family protein [Alphaproteobacteria bacterium]MBU2149851.1 mitochondrial fission ELM1 family protein [Alphaproteobacteria bacterium]MBU2308243.1 mitochondrial fission ELM1 family protein [Alphaproteobacteria bacterium]